MKTHLLFFSVLVSCLPGFAQTPIVIDWLGPNSYQHLSFDQAGDTTYIARGISQGVNLWQPGSTQKNFFASALAGQGALMTDTVNDYPVNNVSSFTMEIINVNAYMCTSIFFQHVYESTQGQDGGTIEVSHDAGLSWKNLIEDSLFLYNSNCGQGTPPYTLNDTVAALGKPGFSGNSAGVEFVFLSFMPLHNMSFQNDTIFLRFTFASDSSAESREGWLIDEMDIDAVGEGIQEYNSSGDISIFPNPASGQFSFTSKAKVDGPLTVTFYDAGGRLVKTQELSSSEVPVADLEDGLYFVTFVAKDYYRSKKVLVRKQAR